MHFNRESVLPLDIDIYTKQVGRVTYALYLFYKAVN